MAPRHYVSAITKAQRQHATFASPLYKLKSRTLSLLDTITGGTVDAETQAEAYRIEEQRRIATCRGCDITFDGIESLAAHHQLFPDHVTRKRMPSRSQSAPMLAATLLDPDDAPPEPPVPHRNRSAVTEPGLLIDLDDISSEQSGLLAPPPRSDVLYSSNTLKPRRSVGSIGREHRKPVPVSVLDDDEERHFSSSESAGYGGVSPALSLEQDEMRRSAHPKGESSNSSFPAWRPFDADAASDSSTGPSPNPGASPCRSESPSPTTTTPHLNASPFDGRRTAAEPVQPSGTSRQPPPPPATRKTYSKPAPPLPPYLRPRRKSTNPFLPDETFVRPPASPGHSPRSPSNPFSAF